MAGFKLLAKRCRMLCVIMLALANGAGMGRAEEPPAQAADQAKWPQQVVVTVGDLRTRIDGPKLWTLSGLDFQRTMMATEKSAYGTVLTIRNVGHLGTAHFLDVPGKPGQVEKEIVERLQLSVDENPIRELAPAMDLSGQSFRLQRTSKIRTMDLVTSISIRDGMLVETVRLRATKPMDLQVAYPWMYAFTSQATVYLFGDDHGIQKRGVFLQEGKTASQVVKNATWAAVFDPVSGKGAVCCFLQHPPEEARWFLLVDAPGVYRKVAAYSLVDKVVPTGFDGVYQSAVGFFTATENDWEEQARKRAAELRTSAAQP